MVNQPISGCFQASSCDGTGVCSFGTDSTDTREFERLAKVSFKKAGADDHSSKGLLCVTIGHDITRSDVGQHFSVQAVVSGVRRCLSLYLVCVASNAMVKDRY